MALQYGAAAEEIKELSNEELARLVLAKKQDKQVEASTKALKENVEKLKELKKVVANINQCSQLWQKKLMSLVEQKG